MHIYLFFYLDFILVFSSMFSMLYINLIQYVKFSLDLENLFLIFQLEEKAMKELLEFYGGEFNPEERITVRRCDVKFINPSWNVQHKHT